MGTGMDKSDGAESENGEEFRDLMRSWRQRSDESERESLWRRLTKMAETGADPFKRSGFGSCAFDEAAISVDLKAIELSARAAERAGISVRQGFKEMESSQPHRLLSILEYAMVDADKVKATAAMRLLVRLGADPEGTPRSRGGPLVSVTFAGNVEAAASLIEAGADAGRLDDEGNTLLHFAVGQSHDASGIWRVLVEAGADPLAVNEHGEGPFDVASAKNAEWMSALREREALRGDADATGSVLRRGSLRV